MLCDLWACTGLHQFRLGHIEVPEVVNAVAALVAQQADTKKEL